MEAEDFAVWLSGVGRLSADQRREAFAALANSEGGREGLGPQGDRKRLRAARWAKPRNVVVARTLWERAAMSGWKAWGVRIARGGRSSPGDGRAGSRGSAARPADAPSTR